MTTPVLARIGRNGQNGQNGRNDRNGQSVKMLKIDHRPTRAASKSTEIRAEIVPNGQNMKWGKMVKTTGAGLAGLRPAAARARVLTIFRSVRPAGLETVARTHARGWKKLKYAENKNKKHLHGRRA